MLILMASSMLLFGLYANWKVSKCEGKSELINLKTIFSKHFITTLVRATGLKSFKHSGELFLGIVDFFKT